MHVCRCRNQGGGQVGHKSGVAIPLLAQVFLSVAENGRAKND